MRHRGLITTASLLVIAGIGAILMIPGKPSTATAAFADPQVATIVHPSVDDASVMPGRLPMPGSSYFTGAPAKPTETQQTAVVTPNNTVAVAQPAAFVTPEATPTPAAITANDKIGGSAVNLRSGPATSAGTVRVLAPGEAVQVGQTQNGWTQVSLADGSSGWVYGSYLASNASQQAAATKPKTKTPRATISGGDGDLQDRGALVADALPAYSQPGDDSPSFTLEAGEHVHISRVRGDWLMVETEDGDSGWIRR